MNMTPKIQSFVMHFGEMGSRWGINRTVGQMFALIVMSEEALSAEALVSALSISRGNASMGLKELQAWRLVKSIHIPGDRKEYYQADGDVWQLAIKVLEERRKREMAPTLSLLRDQLLDEPTNSTDEFAQTRMQEIHDLLEMVSHWSLDLQDMSHEKLQTLMKLGAGVGKILDIKDKLIRTKENPPKLE